MGLLCQSYQLHSALSEILTSASILNADFEFSVNGNGCSSVGRKRKKQQQKNLKRSLEIRARVPQHNIRGAWKQQGVVTKSTWRRWTKEKLTSLFKSNENSTGKKDDTLKMHSKMPASMTFQQLLE